MILTTMLISHLTITAFKPLSLFKRHTKTQTVETPVKLAPAAITEAFKRSA